MEQETFIPGVALPVIQASGQDWSQISVPSSHSKFRLECSAPVEAIVHTTFSEVNGEDYLGDDQETTQWIEHAKSMCDEAEELTGDTCFNDLAKDYLDLGQVSFFSIMADLYAVHGFPVYDGDEYFEVYAKEDTQEVLAYQE